MFLRRHWRSKDGKDHTDGSLVETVRPPDGPRQRTLCYLGELNDSAQARWLKTIEVFHQPGESHQLKLFPSDVVPPEDDTTVARVRLDKVRLERSRRFGDCFLGLELWKRLELDRFWEPLLDRPENPSDVPWSRVAALLAINRLCAPGRELGIEQRWYPATALDDLLGIAVLRLPPKPSHDDLLAAAQTLIGALHQGDIDGRLWIVQKGRVREYQEEVSE